jgi:transposase, IS30 family
MGKGRPGPAPQTAKREQFAALIARGVSNLEACRIVGINRRTGKRWRHGRTITSSSGRRLHYAPVIDTRKREISPRFLSEDERVLIGDRRRAGHSMRAIARELGRDPATVSRELRRNRDREGGSYRPFLAHRMASQRRARPRAGKLMRNDAVRELVQRRLTDGWSPEQIVQLLRQRSSDPAERVAVETIYQAVYRPELGGLRRTSLPLLHTGRRRRRPRRRADQRRPGGLVDMTMISERPAEANDRRVPGHWEGDLIVGAQNRSAIGTLVERSSRSVILVHLSQRHTAGAVRDAVVAAFSTVPAQLRRSLTWDQGKEMALHAEITRALDMPVYFCAKASLWQRPLNENTNGLLRRFFPKGTNLSQHSVEDLLAVERCLNDRPRKILGWLTPAATLSGFVTDPRSHTLTAPAKTKPGTEPATVNVTHVVLRR